MRPHRLGALLGAAALLAAGCGATDTSTGAAGSAAVLAGPGAPGAGPDRLTIAVEQDFGPLNVFASHEEPLTELVYDKLLAPSPYVKQPAPWLATTVRMIDPSTWETDLRTDVRWHDGRPFGPNDVAFSFDYFKKVPTGRWTHHVSDIPTIESIEAVDADTVRYTCAFPCPDLGTVTLADLPILPAHVWSTIAPEDAKAATNLPVGTGPYKLVEYSPTSGYRFEANAEYFAGRPRVRELVMPVIGDPSAAFTAMRAKQIDATFHHVPPELVDELSRDGDGIEVVKTFPLQFPEIRMNYERAPFSDPKFRRALSRALDRDQLLNTVLLGKGRPAVKGYPHPDAPFAEPSLSTPYNPDEARALLDEVGFRDTDGDGFREGPNGKLSWPLFVEGARGVPARYAELIAEDLREVGLQIRVESKDAGAMAALATNREFDLHINQITAHGVADPMQFIMSHRSGYLWKAPKVPYPAWDALFEQWKATTTISSRIEVMKQMQVLFNDAPTSIPITYPDEYWAVREGYDGWAESPGYGVVHKFSLLPAEVGRNSGAVVARS